MNRDFPTRTDAGRRWLVKALHPAEGTLKAERCPGNSVYPTTTQEVTSTFVVEAPEGTGTWDLRVVTHTDPLIPVVVYARSSRVGDVPGNEVYVGEYFNQAFYKGGEAFANHAVGDYHTIMHAFQQAAEGYRITALSTTGVFVGATMTDQGSIVASQFVDRYHHMAYNPTAAIAPNDGFTALADFWVDPLPSMSEATLGQHPYISDARAGWYAPQKLMEPDHWQTVNDLRFRGRLRERLDYGNSIVEMADVYGYPNDLRQQGASYWIRTCDEGCCQVFARGLDRTTSFRITVRLAVEYACTPSNDFAAFAEEAAGPDETAVALYTEIARNILDAYPSEYNDLGKFFGRVKEIAKRVAGFVDPIAGIAAAAGVPFAGVIQAMAKGMKSDAQAFIDNPGKGGLKDEITRLRAEAAVRKEEKAAKAEAKKIKAKADAAVAAAAAKIAAQAKAAAAKKKQ